MPITLLKSLYQVQRMERSTRAELSTFHESLLPDIIRNAYKLVPMYAQLYKDIPARVLEAICTPAQLRILPPIEKKWYREFPKEERFARGFTPENTQRNITSGSSGIPLEIYNSEKDQAYLRVVYLNDILQTGLRPWDRVAYFRVGAFLTHSLQRFNILPFYHIHTNERLEEQVKSFLQAQPTYLTGFPSVIFALMKELKRLGTTYNKVHHILLGGEYANPAMRTAISNYFAATTREIYSSVETFTIARECSMGNKHVHLGEVIVEVEKDDGTYSLDEGEGEIVITRLLSEAMPLIRYKLGDRIQLVSDDCACKEFNTPIIRHILGRSQDFLMAPDHTLINGDHITKPIQKFYEIRQFQILQLTPERLKILVVLPQSEPAICLKVAETLNSEFPYFIFEVEQIDTIPLEANGKMKLVKSLINMV